MPIDTQSNYNAEKGAAWASSLKNSGLIREGGTHGLSGGFSTTPTARAFKLDEEGKVDMSEIHLHPSGAAENGTTGQNTSFSHTTTSNKLNVQTLAGKIVEPTRGDPTYMLGRFENGAMHLTQLDALVQLRPELHHLDAAEEADRALTAAAFAAQQRSKSKEVETNINPSVITSAGTVGGPSHVASTVPFSAAAGGSGGTAPVKIEGRAVDIKLKSSGGGPGAGGGFGVAGASSRGGGGGSSGPMQGGDPTTNSNLRLLRSIQQEPWQSYRWVDQDDPLSRRISKTTLLYRDTNDGDGNNPSTAFDHDIITTGNSRAQPKEPKLRHGSRARSSSKLLQSVISNSQWLHLMSAPRIERTHTNKGDKRVTLLEKVRGKERERLRREEKNKGKKQKTMERKGGDGEGKRDGTRERGKGGGDGGVAGADAGSGLGAGIQIDSDGVQNGVKLSAVEDGDVHEEDVSNDAENESDTDSDEKNEG